MRPPAKLCRWVPSSVSHPSPPFSAHWGCRGCKILAHRGGPESGAPGVGRLMQTGGLAHQCPPACPQASGFTSLSISVLQEAGMSYSEAILHWFTKIWDSTPGTTAGGKPQREGLGTPGSRSQTEAPDNGQGTGRRVVREASQTGRAWSSALKSGKEEKRPLPWRLPLGGLLASAPADRNPWPKEPLHG